MKALGLAAGLAAGYAQGKRQKELKEERDADREIMRGLRTAQINRLNRMDGGAASQTAMPVMADEFAPPPVEEDLDGVEDPMMQPNRRDGGLVGHPNQSRASHDWQRQSFKK